jgi:hypothetical protein
VHRRAVVLLHARPHGGERLVHRADRQPLAGHAISVPRVHWGMGDDNCVVLLNSWGRDNWGKNGRSELSEDALRALIEDDPMDTAIAAME